MTDFKRNFRFLKRFDMFGYPVSLSFKKNTTYQTLYGGFFTLLLVFAFIMISVYSMYKLFNQDYKETFKYETNLGETYGSLPLNGNNFMMAVKFDAEQLNNWTIPYINVSLIKVTQFRNETKTFKIKNRIGLFPCNETHFPGIVSEFNKLNLRNALCPDLSANLTLEGNFQENTFTYLQYALTACENPLLCQNNLTIKNTIEQIDKLRFTIYLLNNNIDETNIENPISRHITPDIHFLIDPLRAVYRTADIYLSELLVETDYGYTPSIMTAIQNLNNYTYAQEYREQTVFTSTVVGMKTNIADFYFRKSQISYHYKRKLGNLLTILSYLGGIWSTGFIFLYFIFCEYSKNKFIMKLSNKIYNYPSEKKKKKIKKMYKPQNSPQNSHFDEPPQSSSKKSFTSKYEMVLAKIKEYLTFEHKLEVGFCQLLRMCFFSIFPFFKKNEKLELFNKTKETLMEDLDLYNILSRIHENEKLKNLILNSDQQKILNFCPKPNILPQNLNIDKTRHSIEISGNFRDICLKSLKRITRERNYMKHKLFSEKKQFNDLQNFKDLITSWRKLKFSNIQQTEIDKNLIKMFGEEFSTIMELDDDVLEGFFEDSNTQDINYKDAKLLKFIDMNKGFFFKKKNQKLIKKEDIQTVEDGKTLQNRDDFTKKVRSLESENFMDINEKIEGIDQILKNLDQKETD